MIMTKKTIDIIGGGIGGLTTAFYLHRQRKDVCIRVWEREAEWGGLCGMFDGKGYRLEKFHHHLYRRDAALQQLVEDVGLPPVEWKPAATGLYYYQQVYQLNTFWQLLRFKPLPFWDRLRVAWMNRRVRATANWQNMDDLSVRDFVVQQTNERVYDTFWRPLLDGKFGKFADKISAAWLWCKLIEQPQEELGYVLGGLGVVFERIVQELKLAGHQFNAGVGIEALELDEQGKISAMQTSTQQKIPVEQVVATVHPHQLADLLPNQFADYQSQLRSIAFLANVCLVMELDRSLSHFYWSRIMDGKVPFTGLVEHTQWTGTELYGGKHLAYISSYVPQEDKRLAMSTETLFDMYLPHIQRLFPDFNKTMVKGIYSWTARYAQPIIEVGYRHKIPAMQTPISNLLLATMAQIYPSDRQLSNGIDKAKEAVKLLLS